MVMEASSLRAVTSSSPSKTISPTKVTTQQQFAGSLQVVSKTIRSSLRGVITASNTTLVSSLLLVWMMLFVAPCLSIIFEHVVSQMSGDFGRFVQLCQSQGFFRVLYVIWPNALEMSTILWIGVYFGMAFALQRIFPGHVSQYPSSPRISEFLDQYLPTVSNTDAGMAAYVVTITLLLSFSLVGIIQPSVVYDKFGDIVASMNLLAFCFGLVLFWTKNGRSGALAIASLRDNSTLRTKINDINRGVAANFSSWMSDFLWGTGIQHPTILESDVKLFLHCRAGMMFWVVGILCFAKKNQEVNHGHLQWGLAVNVALQLIYLTKFYYREMEYMHTKDIQHSLVGYYSCWKCLVGIPSICLMSTFYLVENCSDDWSSTQALALFVCGLVMIAILFDADEQRYNFRQSNGKCKINGKIPDHIVATLASSVTDESEIEMSLLLVDGWWKMARHVRFVPEVLANFCMSYPAWDTNFFTPYVLYMGLLSILLLHRAIREEDRSRRKYGQSWEEYCEKVPFKFLPGLV